MNRISKYGSRICRASLLQNVLFPPTDRVRVNVLGAERALRSPCWLGFYTLVVVELFSEHDLLALVVHLVLIGALALLNQVVV